jgi:tryptophan 2,3-dioxygenase
VTLSYGSYLKIDELLDLQQPLSRPPHHDEMLFIIIHQVYELWFKQLLHEVDATMGALDRDDLLRVAKHFRRIHAIQRLIEQQVDILETMTPQEFNQFRDNLNPASGFQSVQFRQLEFACGLRQTNLLK